MATADVQLSLSQADHSTLDSLLHTHLRLEPLNSQGTGGTSLEKTPELETSGGGERNISLQKRLRSMSQTSEAGTKKISRISITQGTIESDNKRRPVVLKRNASRYQPPSPEPPDPNSEAKSATIRRMQSNLEDWDQQLQDICNKKATNDSIQRSELNKRDGEIKELTEKFTTEHELRVKAEQERDQLKQTMKEAEEDLVNYREQVTQFQSDLSQYEMAYHQLEINKNELDQEVLSVREQLEQSENMRRRLNDQVTELQGQLAIEEQRSRFCVLL